MLGARRIHAAERQQTGGPAHTPPVMAVTPPCSSAVVRANPARPRGPGLAMREPVILRRSGGKRRCVQMAERRLTAAAGGGHGSQRGSLLPSRRPTTLDRVAGRAGRAWRRAAG